MITDRLEKRQRFEERNLTFRGHELQFQREM